MTQNSPADLLKRLKVVMQSIELGDLEMIAVQVQKLHALNPPQEVLLALRLIEERRYSDAVAALEQYLKGYEGIAAYISPEVAALRLELQGLESEYATLLAEKAETERIFSSYERLYEQKLGDLIREILSLRKKIAKKQAEKEPNNAQYKAKYEETEQDYEEYEKNYEAHKKEKIFSLSPEEKQRLKELYRKAVKLCHPDLFGEEATQLMQELNRAYQAQELAAVESILIRLEKGEGFVSKHEQLMEATQLKQRIAQLRNFIASLSKEIERLKADTTYQKIIEIDDLDVHFALLRTSFEKQLEALRLENLE